MDLKHSEAAPLLEALVARADVLVQNLAPGATARMGLSFEQLHDRYPGLVVCDISGYGDMGPYRDRKAYDMLVQADAGLVAATGDGDVMARAGFSAADVSAGMFAYSSILSALLLRGRTRKGSRIDVSMLETLAEWMGNPMYYTFDGQPPAPRTGASHPSIAPYGPARAGDGQHVLLSIQNEREWERFCAEVLGDVALATDPRFVDNMQRTKNRAALDELISARFADMTTAQAEARLLDAGIATARINSAAALWEHPQLRARERWTSVGSPAGAIPALIPPATNSSYDARMDAVPSLGEHTDAVLAELGCDRARIDALHTAGAV